MKILSTLISCLLLSTYALAQEPTPPNSVPASVNPAEQEATNNKAKAGEEGKASTSESDDDNTLKIKDSIRILQSIEQQKRKITQSKEENERRMDRLNMLKKEVEGKYKALRLLQEELTDSIQQKKDKDEDGDEKTNSAQASAEKAAQIAQVAKIFDKAKPASAAKIAEEMDESLVVDVLRRIKASQAAKIMSNIKPELAAKITAKMANKK